MAPTSTEQKIHTISFVFAFCDVFGKQSTKIPVGIFFTGVGLV